MRRGIWLSGLTALFVSSACFPSRDNSSDPAVRPNAQLVVASDSTVVPCPAGGAGNWAPISLASRGACLALDARASTDPRGAELTGYVFAVDTGGGAQLLLPTDTQPLTGDGSLVQLTRSFIQRFHVPSPANLQLFTFQVAVTDADGYTGTSQAQVVLTNSRPVAVGDPPRRFPEGGFAWAPGQPFLVTYDAGGSRDPDGDPLTYCWRFSDHYPTQCVSDPVHSIVRPVSALPLTSAGVLGTTGSVLAALSVSDGTLTSPAVPSLVWVGDPVFWSANGWTQGLSVSSLDTERSAPDPLLHGAGFVLMTSTNANPTVALHVGFSGSVGQASPVTLLSWPPPTASLGSASLPYLGGGFTKDPFLPERLWVWNVDLPASGRSELTSFDVGGATLHGNPVEAIQLPGVPFCGVLEDCSISLTADDLGHLWMGMANTSAFALSQSSADGSATIQYGNLGAGVSPRAIRWRNGANSASPGVDEVWVAEEAAFGSQGGARLAVYDSANPAAPLSLIPLPGTKVRELLFSGPDQFWIELPDLGIFLVDAFLLEQGYDFSAATIQSIPLQTGVTFFEEAPDGSLWTTTTEGELLNVQKNGTVSDLGPGLAPLFADPAGALLFTQFPAEDAAYRGFSPLPSGVWIRAPKTAQNGGYPSAAPDGSLYLLVPSENELVRYSLEGALEAEFTQVSLTPDGSTPVAFPPAFPAVSSPDGEWLWTLEGLPGGNHTGIFRYSLAGALPARSPPGALGGSAGLAAGRLADQVASKGDTLIPSAPNGEPSFAWVVFGGLSAGATVGLVTTDGAAVTTRFTVPATEAPNSRFGFPFGSSLLSRRPYAVDRSLSTNDLCLATMTTAGVLSVRWINPFGSGSPPLFTQAVGGGSILAGVAVAPSANGNEACWVSTTLPGATCPGVLLSQGETAPTGTSTVLELDSAAHLVRSASGLTGVANGLRALGPDTLWLSLYRCSPGFDDERLRLPWIGATLDTADELDLPADGTRGLLAP